jgi:creatinine amidohydrolase
LRLEELRPLQLQKARDRAPVAYVPLGTIEWHERHLPLGNDALKAQGICLRAAQLTGGIVFPPLYWAVDRWAEKDGRRLRGKDYDAGYPLPGSMYQVDEDLFENLLRQMLKEIFAQEFRVVVLMTGHNARNQEAIVKSVAHDFNMEAGRRCVWGLSEYEPVADKYEFARDHAGKWETCLQMALNPALVDMSQLPQDLKVPLTATSGVDPRIDASRELGERILEDLAQAIAGEVRTMLAAAKPKER